MDTRPPRARRAALAPWAFVLLLSTGAVAPSLFLGAVPAQTDSIHQFGPWLDASVSPHNRLSGDSFFVYLPDRLEAVRQWKEGKLPLWNPYVGCGVPLLGLQTATPLDPLLPLMLLFPLGLALGLQYFFCLLVAGAGMILYLRHLGIRHRAALALASGAYLLNPYHVCFLEDRVFLAGLCTLPVSLYLMERILQGKARLASCRSPCSGRRLRRPRRHAPDDRDRGRSIVHPRRVDIQANASDTSP